MPGQPSGKSKSLRALWFSVPLRVKGVAVMAIPLAAIFVMLFAVYTMVVDIQAADQTLLAEMQSHSHLLSSEQVQRLIDAQFQLDLLRHRLFRWFVLCGAVGPVGALFLQLIMAGRLVRRLGLAKENARRLAQGLPLEPFPPGNDEVATLARQIEDAAYLLGERERDLRESEQRYRDLFDRAPVAFEEIDREGVVTRLNQAVCSLLRCPPDVGRRAWDLVAPDQQESFRAGLLERLASGAEARPFECDYLLQDGSRLVVETRESFIRNKRGEITGMVRSLVDITERNLAAVASRKVSQYALELRNKNELLARALVQSRAATEAKSRFLASVSHELRTPLNGIIGFTELLHDGKLGGVSEEHREVLGDILTSARHLLQLINDILDLSKVEAGKMEFRPEPSRIAALVGEVRDVVRPLADKKDIALSLDVPEELTAVTDPSRFKQILYNYLSNAVKFTPREGRIQVRVTCPDDSRFALEVEDTGIGIAAGDIQDLFQEFQQLQNGGAQSGTGLGLSLTRRIVEAQGGSVAVRSEPGKGSVFSAILPLRST